MDQQAALPAGAMPIRDLRIGTVAALTEEFGTILGEPGPAAGGGPPREAMSQRDRALWNSPRAALCLSGGGIRSAAFSLGVLQACAQAGFLFDFHYLSTVSGGGYVGSWLAAVMEHGGGIAAARQALTKDGDPRFTGLRDFTNFLTPSPGPASADTRAAVVMWLRNVLLNWLIFGPAMFAIALLPAFYLALLGCAPPVFWGIFVALAGLAALLSGTIVVCRDIPAHRYDPTATPAGVTKAAIRRSIVLPVLLWATLAPLAYAWMSASGAPRPELSRLLCTGTFFVLVAGYIIAWLSVARNHRDGYRQNAIPWLFGSATAGLVLLLAIRLGASLSLAGIATLGPACVIGAHLLHSTVYVGLRRASRYGELDQEWLARLNADKLAPPMLWAALAAATLLLPGYLAEIPHTKLVALATGPAGAWLASSTKSLFGRKTPPGSDTTSWLKPAVVETAIGLATIVFAAVLFALLAEAGMALVEVIGPGRFKPALLAALASGAFLIAYALGRRVNVNRFSLHGVYRIRLIRAFLGTARLAGRQPDPYTNFDPADNLRMHSLYPNETPPRRLFPIVHTTLNLVTSKRTAWAERKAAPFTMTPLRAGADCLHMPDGTQGVFVRSDSYGGGERERGPNDGGDGITLGGAMTISGAAVSPNMGYHTRPATAFLMTLFDVRLGAWMPNPAKSDNPAWLNQGRPNNALFALAAEMFGRSDDTRDNVYLSDGGHFDNLGLYEMCRRECRTIVVVDAGCDGDYAYGDLGDSIRRAAIDLGTQIDFAPAVRRNRRVLPPGGGCATIRYRSGAVGRLIYLKPWLPTGMPADVMAYAAAHGDFPHESTADQFFTESQFESYRHLGNAIAASAIGAATSLEGWFSAACPSSKGTPS